MRAELEYVCRATQFQLFSYVPAVLPYSLSNRPLPLSLYLDSYLTTTFAIYIFDKRQFDTYICAMDIENWLWRQWFKPYESIIHFHRFYSIFNIKYDVNLADCEFSPERLVAFHCNNCEQAQRYRDATMPAEENDGSTPTICGPLRCLPWPWRTQAPETLDPNWRSRHVMQPIFRAIFMTLFFPQEFLFIEDVPKTKVQLVLTGITEGLSAPISFEELQDEADPYHVGATTIITTLGAAVPFLMRLEQREITASGAQPDVAKMRGHDWHRERAKEFGWVEERDGNLDDLTPRSHEWVNREIFTKWVGGGAEETLLHTYNIGTSHNPLKDSEENWWWDRDMLPEEGDDAP
ncbi:hypothetical protein F4678DRAFT_473079 [Xylaria arbuscula]|nr:hypothetical protein F4678DRAFT_473079 [Xylaria arbuscula]